MAQRTLIILAIVLTGLAFFAAEADFWSDHASFRHYYHRSTGFTSFRVSHRGEIELDAAETGIVGMGPDAQLDVRERRFTSRRRLEVRGDAAGRPVYYYKVGARERSREDAEAYLASVMQEIVRTTTVGASARARRLLDEDGLGGLLGEVSYLRSNAARRIYLEVAAGMDGLEPAQAVEIIRTAGRELTSSSQLRGALTDLAERMPLEWGLSAELAEAAESIASSSEKGGALVDIARLRSVGPVEAPSFAEAASTIASGSEKGRTITRIYRLDPSAELAEALLATADTIESSSERQRVLSELVGEPGLPESVYSRALDVGSDIASSSGKAAFLATVAQALPASDDLQVQFIDVAGSIAASSEAKRALMALITSTDLSVGVCRAWIESAGKIASARDSTDLLVESAARCPEADAVWRAYFDAVERIGASGEQRRALMALLDRGDLGEETLSGTVTIAERSIASTGERQIVLDRVDEVRGELTDSSRPG